MNVNTGVGRTRRQGSAGVSPAPAGGKTAPRRANVTGPDDQSSLATAEGGPAHSKGPACRLSSGLICIDVSLLVGLVLFACTTFAAPGARPDLTGRVVGEDGSPVPKATVFIYTAGPKLGTSSLCPSCYVDCGKRARTDAEGRFKIESLDPKLLFRLLVVAGGREANFVSKVDPAAGSVDITMTPLDPQALKSKTRIAGIVMGPEGQPVLGATIGVEGVGHGDSTRWGGTDAEVDPIAVTDDQGRFLLRCKEEITAVHAIAEARGVAKRWVKLTPGRDHLVRMEEGVTITGRIVRDGQALKDVVLGLTTTERACGICLHDFETATDARGRFVLSNVTPDNRYFLFSKMESLREQGTLPVMTVKTGATGTTLDLGDLELRPAHRVAGRVLLADGKPVPADTRIFLGRQQAWDHTESVLGPEGRFEFEGVPTESVSLSVRVKGYKFSKRNPSLDWLNGSIIGRVEADIPDLTLVLEPGQWQFSRQDEDLPPGTERQPSGKPLRGAKF